LGFPNRVLRTRFHPQRLGHFAPLSFTAYGGKIQATRFKIREKYGIRASTSVHWVEKEEGILMIPDSEDPIVAARGMLKGSGILKAYLEDKMREKEKEDKKGHAR
jgi:hypothetical protein